MEVFTDTQINFGGMSEQPWLVQVANCMQLTVLPNVLAAPTKWDV